MVDLRQKGLPNCLEIDGNMYPIKTDFRVWIEAERSLRVDGVMPYTIFDCIPPEGVEWAETAREFLECPNATPNADIGVKSSDRAFDFVLDGAYIVAGFMQAYGIDLTECDMHWFMFKALFDGLPEETKISHIMTYRTWNNSKKKQETVYRELKRAWRLPEPGEAEQIEAAKDAAAALFDMLGGEGSE